MKKFLTLFVSFSCAVAVNAQNFSLDGRYVFQEDSLLSTMTLNKNDFVIKYENPPVEKENLTLKYAIEHIYGMPFIKLSEKMPAEVANWLDFEENNNLKTDDKILFLAFKVRNYKEMFAYTKGYKERGNWLLTRTGLEEKGCSFFDCSSSLIEKNKEYPVSNLSMLKSDMPWVEGAPGYGIGEGFSIASYGKKIAPYLFIMNGYISYEKPYLYKQNGRVKKIKVKGLKSGKEKVLDVLDTPHPQTVDISFITEPEDIRVTIEEVYPGTKYEDTCIHYMITYFDEVIPYENSIDEFLSKDNFDK